MPDLILDDDALKRSDVELEKSMLATLAMDPSAYFDVKSIVTSEIFTTRDTLQAFNEIASAYEENRAMPNLDVTWRPTDNHIETAKKLFELWQKRQLVKLPKALAEDLKDVNLPADVVLTKMQSELNRVQALIRDQSVDKAHSVTTIFSEVIKNIETKRGVGFGVSMGLERLDNMLGGLQPALHLVAGAPGLGKTTLCLQIATRAAMSGIPALFITFDEVLWRLTLKAFCQMEEIPMKRYADGKFTDEQAEDLKRAYEKHGKALANLHLVEGSSRIQVPNLESMARQALRRTPGAESCLIIVDYLQRWASLRMREEGEFGATVSTLVGELREMAFRLNAPTIVVSSLSRTGYEDPTIKDLKETGDLEFSADTAMLMRENIRGTERMKRLDGTLLPRALRINVAKNRYGALGEVHLMFDLENGKIVEKA